MPFAQVFLRPYARLATTSRLMLYGTLSMLAVSVVILNAFRSYSNFYAVAVHLSRSNRSVMVLANFGILCSVLVGHGFQQLFFGSLRASEVERLYDKIWFFLTESLLAFTIFRDEFDASFAVMFGFLLFVKCFHWLMSFRIEWMDQVQYPGPNIWFHIRINILFFFLWFIDVTMVFFSIESIMTNGIGAIVLFASEYSILLASAFNSICKYLIIWYDTRRAASRGGENAPVWEDKSMYIFYVELATDFLKLVTYMTFFLVVLTFYGLPLNIVRDIYITARSFFQRCRDLIRYRTATRNMDERYPNATEPDLVQLSDRTCIICREEMHHREPVAPQGDAAQNQQLGAAGAAHYPSGVNDTPKKLPCGHIFHFHCLRSWLERQQSCPTCRRTVLEPRAMNGPGIGAAQGANAPVPGAVPQPDGGAPPRGFLARWLRGAGMVPPVIPGQFVAGPMANNIPGQAQVQQAQQQPFQPQQQQQPFGFPNPFGPWMQPQAPQNQQYQQAPQQHQQQQPPPAPVQVLQGFYIGNQWQPWGQEHQPHVRVQAQPQQPYPAWQANPPTPTPTVPTDTSDSNSTPSTSPVTSPDAPTASTSSPTPREAAALAALKRFGSVGNASTSSSSSQDQNNNLTSTSHVQSQRQSRLPVPTGSSTLHVPERHTTFSSAATSSNVDQNNTIPSLIPLTPSSSASSTTPPTTTRSRPSSPFRSTPVPSLIPLFDPASTSATIVPPPSQGTRSSTSARPHSPYPSPAPASNVIPPIRPDDMTVRDFRDLLRYPTPFPLTEEQLRRLDMLTREAIDERLRIIEDVQGVMWRCAEELVRARSMLPAARRTNETGNPGSAPSSSTPTTSVSNPPNAKSSAKDGNVELSVNGTLAGPSASTSLNVEIPKPTELTVSDTPNTKSSPISPIPLAEVSSSMGRLGKERERDEEE
ncbi:hypothetical protein Clacol_000479 [Clathrus columnatus]|uniref:RING-type E3 ubiquitin transferase n=1 Tax=Clathrus columnatus TaxID=1419009 RepID=A0AAV4ZYM5_9AGAM|nr:hypothetical protein Clacol_000479 [Clathrus columnatus]